jgi:pimeloyl-ACP methyl ester carboxylesterase
MKALRKNWKKALGGAATVAVAGTAAVIALGPTASAAPAKTTVATAVTAVADSTPKPTIVLVHGGFADASSWTGVVARLQDAGYPVTAPADPLRGVPTDAPYLADLLKTIKGPIILVGHSYGGAVITTAAAGNPNVKALVYVSALVPDTGETLGGLIAKFPGSQVQASLNLVPYSNPDGTTGVDAYLQPDKFRALFAADLPAQQAREMAAEQRPFNTDAFGDVTTAAAWHAIPVYGVVAGADKSLPPALERWEYQRANAREVVEVPGASHVVMISHPGVVTKVIEDAAKAAR